MGEPDWDKLAHSLETILFKQLEGVKRVETDESLQKIDVPKLLHNIQQQANLEIGALVRALGHEDLVLDATGIALQKIIVDDRKDIIDHPRYWATRYVLGEGMWGRVYLGVDSLYGSIVALKVPALTSLAREQATHRKLSVKDAFTKEALELAACSYIVPRDLHYDRNDKPVLVMPVFTTFLDFFMNGRPASECTVLRAMHDVACGLDELHSRGRVHGDLKPENIAYSASFSSVKEIEDMRYISCLPLHEKFYINDLGTSTEDVRTQGNPRSNMGCEYTRAPELFKEGSRPTTQSDVWAFGSLMYTLMTGKELLSPTLDKPMGLKIQKGLRMFMPLLKFVARYDEAIANQYSLLTNKFEMSVREGIRQGNPLAARQVELSVWRQLRENIRQPYRDYLTRCLALKPENRISGGHELWYCLRDIIEARKNVLPRGFVYRTCP